ncbi:hypothetical protein N185_34390 [Sinorhizobium sp. GW3]|nr:hypothetical protein N185_34390 [Sinorhizobium sp. GW3]
MNKQNLVRTTIVAPALVLAVALGSTAFAQEKKPDASNNSSQHGMSGSMIGMDQDMSQMMASCDGMMQSKNKAGNQNNKG